MTLISIIIPAFNAEKKIEKCLKSLEKQTNKEFEVFLIDDNSEDKTLSIAKRSKKKVGFPIHVLKNKKNLGAGETRNIGIQACASEYLMFLDADDYLEETCLETIHKILRKKQYDCIIFDYYINKGKLETVCHTINRNKGIQTTEETLIYCNGNVCCKIFKTDIIKKHHIRFPNLKRNEDMVFVKEAISYCSEILYIPKPFYHYVMHKMSLMHQRDLLDEQNAFQAYRLLCQNLNKHYKNVLEILFVKEVVYSTTITMVIKGKRKKELQKHLSDLEHQQAHWYNNAKKYYHSTRERVIFFLIKKRYFNLLRIAVWLQNIAKKILR